MNRAFFYATTALAGAAMIAPAAAQEVDEIVVTATKREQTLQEVPIAVTVVQEETIQDAQIVDVLDLQSIVPSLRVSQLERSSNTTFTIRGIGNGANNPGIEPSVAVFVDGVFRTRVGSALDDFINLERVEVLKGPQSTLFGKNASAGVVSIVTKKPEFEFGGTLEGTVGNYNSRIVRGHLTGPLNDLMAFSVSGAYNVRDGYFDNLGPTDDYNNRDRYSLRGQLLFQPTDNFEARVIADYSEIEERCCGTARVTDGSGAFVRLVGGVTPNVGAFDYTIANDFENNNQIENSGISLQADWDLNVDNTLTYIGAYRKYEDFVNYEGDFTTLDLLGNNVRGLDTDTMTHELRLVGQKDRLSYLLGGFYFQEDMEVTDSRLYGADARAYADVLTSFLADGNPDPAGSPLTGLEFALGLPIGQTFYQDGAGTSFVATQDDRQYQIFGQFDFDITDRLTFTAGAAYFQADKEVDFTDVTRTNPFSDLNLVQIGFGSLFSGVSGLPATPANVAAFAGSSPQAAAIVQALQNASIVDPDDALAAGGVDVGGVVVDPSTGLPIANPFLALFPDLQPLGPLTPFPNAVEDGESSDDNVPYTLRLSYDATDRTNVYVSYATGFKATSWNLTPDTRPFASDFGALSTGGILGADGAFGSGPVVNTAIALQAAGIPNQYTGTRFAGPEETKVFELGLKTRLPFGSLNVAVFDQKIEGFQSSTFQGTGFVLANAGEQSVQGFEFDTIIVPPFMENLTLNIAGMYLDAEYEDYAGAAVVRGSDIDAADGVVDGLGNLAGQTPAGIPEFSGSFGFDYRIPVSVGEWFIRGDYQYETEVQVVDNIPEEILNREVGMLNASFGVQLDNGLEAMIWGRNINQDEFFTSGFPTTLQNFPSEGILGISGYPNMPRTYGFTLRKRW
ncbi:MAG: TonB-dependent receptor [Parvularcula sp.]|jgi:outer membrane receptor protein involved in Fe transport|nr:TonB-dependent receptor [Parvularcula sp.]